MNIKNYLNKILTINKVYILNPTNNQYEYIETQKRQNNSFYSKILQNNKIVITNKIETI
jgi:hypothetical protein